MYVVLPPKQLRVLAESNMFFRPEAERGYRLITVHQVSQHSSGIVVASAANPAVAEHLCSLLNRSPYAEEMVTTIRDGIFHRVPGFATPEAEVLQFLKRK